MSDDAGANRPVIAAQPVAAMSVADPRDKAGRLRRLARFAIVGVANTAIDFTVFAVLFYGLGWPLLAAHAAGFSLAVVNSYLLNKTWTFGDRRRSRLVDGVRFLLVAISGLVAGSAVIAVAAEVMPPLAAKGCAVAATFVVNYWASARYVFVRGAMP